MSVGWGLRGQFGDQYGAALAGALGAMAVALLSGREDWRRRMLGTGSRVAGVLLAAQSDRSRIRDARDGLPGRHRLRSGAGAQNDQHLDWPSNQLAQCTG